IIAKFFFQKIIKKPD
ncbi:TonB-dependent heme receptor A precursor, partial [Haemophilus influenzae]